MRWAGGHSDEEEEEEEDEDGAEAEVGGGKAERKYVPRPSRFRPRVCVTMTAKVEENWSKPSGSGRKEVEVGEETQGVKEVAVVVVVAYSSITREDSRLSSASLGFVRN